jgi:hypothetical protein
VQSREPCPDHDDRARADILDDVSRRLLQLSLLVGARIDGGGLVTLSGDRRRRILYLDTCDRRQIWTTSHCQNQATPRLTVERLGLRDGNSTGRRFDGGAIYNDGDRMSLRISRSTFTHNHANEGGGPIFFVSNDRTGALSIAGSTLTDNVSDGFHTAGLPGIFFLGAHRPSIVNSKLR